MASDLVTAYKVEAATSENDTLLYITRFITDTFFNAVSVTIADKLKLSFVGHF